MATELLTAFWILPPGRDGPLGFGVTAYDLADALGIIRSFGYADSLQTGHTSLKVIHGVKVAGLEDTHVRVNMGPIVVRGLWYPFVRVGL